MKSLKQYVLEDYLPYYSVRAYKSIRADLNRVEIMLKYPIMEKDITKINRNDISAFIQQLQSKRSVKKSTVNRYHSRLQAIFSHAYYEGVVSLNPVSQVKRYKECGRKRALTDMEVCRLLEECSKSKNKKLYLIVIIALYTGMRCGEIINLKKDNLHNYYIELNEGQTKSGYGRFIPIHKELVPFIQKHVNDIDSEHIFNLKSFRTAFENAVKRAKIEDFRFHDLRRTCATRLKDNDINMHTISNLLGHSSIVMTERYLANNDDALTNAVNTLSFLDLT